MIYYDTTDAGRRYLSDSQATVIGVTKKVDSYCVYIAGIDDSRFKIHIGFPCLYDTTRDEARELLTLDMLESLIIGRRLLDIKFKAEFKLYNGVVRYAHALVFEGNLIITSKIGL